MNCPPCASLHLRYSDISCARLSGSIVGKPHSHCPRSRLIPEGAVPFVLLRRSSVPARNAAAQSWKRSNRPLRGKNFCRSESLSPFFKSARCDESMVNGRLTGRLVGRPEGRTVSGGPLTRRRLAPSSASRDETAEAGPAQTGPG